MIQAFFELLDHPHLLVCAYVLLRSIPVLFPEYMIESMALHHIPVRITRLLVLSLNMSIYKISDG